MVSKMTTDERLTEMERKLEALYNHFFPQGEVKDDEEESRLRAIREDLAGDRSAIRRWEKRKESPE